MKNPVWEGEGSWIDHVVFRGGQPNNNVLPRVGGGLKFSKSDHVVTVYERLLTKKWFLPINHVCVFQLDSETGSWIFVGMESSASL